MKDIWRSVPVTNYELVIEIEEVTVYVMPACFTAHSLTDAESNEVERASWVFSDANHRLDGLSRSGDDFLVRGADM